HGRGKHRVCERPETDCDGNEYSRTRDCSVGFAYGTRTMGRFAGRHLLGGRVGEKHHQIYTEVIAGECFSRHNPTPKEERLWLRHQFSRPTRTPWNRRICGHSAWIDSGAIGRPACSVTMRVRKGACLSPKG